MLVARMKMHVTKRKIYSTVQRHMDNGEQRALLAIRIKTENKEDRQ
jgi:hypothetical protein